MKKLSLFLMFSIILIFLAGCTVKEDNMLSKNNTIDEKGFNIITKQQCEEANGYWNECGSPCAGTDAEICIQVCKEQCECGGIAGFRCPEGFKCRLSGKVADEAGVCIK